MVEARRHRVVVGDGGRWYHGLVHGHEKCVSFGAQSRIEELHGNIRKVECERVVGRRDTVLVGRG